MWASCDLTLICWFTPILGTLYKHIQSNIHDMESVCIKEARCVYDRGRDLMNIGISGTKITVHNRETSI